LSQAIGMVFRSWSALRSGGRSEIARAVGFPKTFTKTEPLFSTTPKTQQGYIRTIIDLAAFIGRSPDKASFEDVRRFQLHLVAKGSDTPTLRGCM
jgi:hypothetical protein